MLLMLEKELQEGYVTLFIDMQKLITNMLKTIIKIKNCDIFNIGMQIIYIVGQCCKSFQ